MNPNPCFISFFMTLQTIKLYKFFFKESVRNPVWICRDPISLILGTQFSLILGTRFEIVGTRIGSLKRLEKNFI